MKNLIASSLTAASLGLLAMSGPALAQNDGTTVNDGSTKANSPEIVERNRQGKATKVRIDGKVYDVCMNSEQDSCINPRAAGLNWGNRPLEYWPGQPASSM
ncbi:hypothetical protein [Qipengyuania nanhaisediminis]|uniref:hypothetical protein n=1 Tax=Qipengyuania nanhaisediminis TaxID=604088 RepID=UPI0038B4009E